MPINSLEPYLFELKAVNRYPLDVLKNSVIGIDVEHYLTRLLPPKREPNLEAIGGFPMTLKTQLESDLKSLHELGIKAIFVFPGLLTEIQYNYLEQPEILPRERALRRVWEDRTTKEYQAESFRSTDFPLSLRPLLDQLLELLDSINEEYIISPYSSWAQLQYMLNQHLINCVFGSTDGLLLDNVDRVILNLEFENKQFKYLDRSIILARLSLTPKQFKDISMCVGNNFQPFTLNIFPHIPSQSTFPALHHFVLNGGSIFNTLLSLGENSRTMELYMKGCSALQFMPVMKVNGRVEPLQIDNDASFLSTPSKVPSTASTDGSSVKEASIEKIPEDMHEFIGQRLPEELFFYQSVGITAFDLCENLVHTNAVERLPLDMALTPLYQRLVTSDQSLELSGKILNLLANPLNRYYQYKKLSLTTYFNGARRYELVQRITPPLYFSLRKLLVRHTTAKSFDLVSLLSGLTDDFLIESTVEPPKSGDSVHISTNYELVSTALVRSFVLYGFVKENEFKLTSWGHAFDYVAHGFNSEYLLLILFFFKQFPDLNLSELIEPNDLKSINREHNKQAVLISKFLALLSMNDLKSADYSGRVSRPLLQFRSVFDKLNSAVNGVVNANLIALLLWNQDDLDKFQRDSKQWKKLALELPFRKSLPSVLLGIVSEQFFETYLDNSDLSKSFSLLNDRFGSVHDDASSELLKGLKAYKEAIGLVKLLAERELIADKEIVDLFTSSEGLVDEVITAK
ncbi:DEKNAAC104879 [Brettanomyces naardenensis]|uniref:DEKNAAC104879 n=1 Tax=Brettanomyces naardenensis TaxID=13370 RepID=A0A448YSJ3_BRENA|nr:DEKNAAC104879 [Brettanomyces naardenensis]